MTGPCSDCWRSMQNTAWGGFQMDCITCCARLVLSGSPDRQQMLAHLDAIEYRPGRPPRDQIREVVKALKASTSAAPPAPEKSS